METQVKLSNKKSKKGISRIAFYGFILAATFSLDANAICPDNVIDAGEECDDGNSAMAMGVTRVVYSNAPSRQPYQRGYRYQQCNQ